MSLRKRRPSSLNRLHISLPEQLEDRAMLAGHGLGGAVSHALATAAAFEAASHRAAAQFTAQALHSNVAANVGALDAAFAESGSHCGGEDQTVFTGTATDSDTGEVANFTATTKTYDGETETQLKVSVTGAAASTPLDVTIDGTVVGTLTTDANGAGSTTIKELTQTLQDGVTQVGLGTLTGTLALSTSSTSGDENASTVTVRRASLSDTDTGAAATVKIKTVTSTDGASSSKLIVKVTGAAASSPLDVAIDGTSVGTLTTDANGAGRLVLHDLTVPVTDTSTVTVGTLSGSLEVVSTHQAGRHWHWF